MAHKPQAAIHRCVQEKQGGGGINNESTMYNKKVNTAKRIPIA